MSSVIKSVYYLFFFLRGLLEVFVVFQKLILPAFVRFIL